ncbi:EF-hand domain-containing family member B [Sigmodon hispidus]
MRAPEIMDVGLTQEQKDDIIDRTLKNSKSPAELGLEMRLGQNQRYRERIASPETKSPLCHALGIGLERHTVSRTPIKLGNLGLHRVLTFQGPRPLCELSGRVESENEGLSPGIPYRGTLQPSLGTVYASPQASGNIRSPTACLELRKELEKEPTCVVVNPYTERPPEEIDIGLPQTQKPGEAKDAEPQIGLVTEPSESPFAQLPEEKKEPGVMEPGVEAPAHIRPIYSGKFFDRMPCWPSLTTPPEAKKYFNFRYPPPGAERVFYGRANDPQIAPYLTHGIRSKISIPVSTLVNPHPITTFQQKIKDKNESIYFSNQRAPLGRSHDQTPGLPKGLDVINTTFGTPIIRELSASDIVNPPKSFENVVKQSQEGHDLYIVSHHDYFAGEAQNRKYNPESFHRLNLYGVPTPHFNDGRTMAKSLHWLHELQMERGAKFVSKRADDFNEKFQHKLGRVLDPISETMNVAPDHTFGACLQPEEYGKYVNSLLDK